MAKIGIFVEQKHGRILPVGLELISEVVKQVGTQEVEIIAVVVTDQLDQENIDKIKQTGPTKVIIVKNSRFKEYDTGDYKEALELVIKQEDFDVLLLGSTLLGRDLAPRLSARVHTGLTADATILEFGFEQKLELLATRPALGGNLMATIVCPNHRPQMATIRPGVFSIYHAPKTDVEIIEIHIKLTAQSKVRRIRSTPLVKKGPDLTKAKMIVAGGRGVATKFHELHQIADLLGAEVAASRAVVDAGKVEKDRLVGQTGTTVKPSVYLALGISGAIQHISGMDKSELIIAVNNDPSASIFNIADVSIISDAHKVIPLVEKYLSDIRSVQ